MVKSQGVAAPCHYKVLSLHSYSICLNMPLIVLLEIVAIYA